MTYKTNDLVLEWFDLYKIPLYGYICSLLRNRADADDVFQETFTTLLQRGEKISKIKYPKTYIYHIARNKSFDLMKKYKKQPVSIESLLVQPAEEVFPDWIDAEMLNAALNKISEKEREIILLKVYDQMTFREIAKITHSLLPTVAARYLRGIKKLKKLMEKNYEE